MVEKRDAIAMTEFLHYIKKFDQSYIDKIPNNLMNLIIENSDKDYICSFDYNKPYDELELTPETHALISLICYKYWSDDEQKKVFMSRWKENSINKDKELHEKYNVDNIFKKEEKIEELKETEEVEESIIEENLPVSTEKQSFISRIVSFVKNIFRKNK